MEKKLRMKPDEVVEAAVKAVKWALEYTDDVEFSAEDAVRSEFDFLCRVFDAVIQAGAKTINVPDTVGYSIPVQWGERMRQLIEHVPNSDKVIWSTHCHNDLGMASANSLAAVLNGARRTCRQCLARRNRHGRAYAQGPLPGRDAHRHHANIAGFASRVADHRLRRAAEQGHRRRQRLCA
jgi:hypothetical protein